MPKYDTHRQESIRWFKWFSALLFLGSLVVLSPGHAILLFPVLAAIAYPAVRAGAMFPDIDHHASLPRRYLLCSLPLVGLLVSVVWVSGRRSQPTSVRRRIQDLLVDTIAGLVGGLVVRAGVDLLLRKFFPHRGPTHTVGAGGAVGAGLGISLYYALQRTVFGSISFLLSPVAAIAFFVGHMSHLSLDEQI